MEKHEIPRAKVGQYYVEMRSGEVAREFYVIDMDGSRIYGIMIAHVPTHVLNATIQPRTLIDFHDSMDYEGGWRKGQTVFTGQHGEKRPFPEDFNHRIIRAVFNYTIINGENISLGNK
jgi:hypothetical protein